MRLDKFLEDKGFKKKEIKKYFKEGHLFINGHLPQSLGSNIDPFYQEIVVKGHLLKGNPHHYILFNKPQGVVTANVDAKDKTVFDFLPEDLKENIRFAGRLDKDTEGLVFLTDNGILNYRLHQARFLVEKTYLVETKEPLEASDIEKMKAGVVIDDDTLLNPAKLDILHPHLAKLTITQGKFHQVKKMFLSLGKKVIFLKRIRIGKLELPDDLKPGQWRELSPEEFEKIAEFFD